MHVQYNLNRSTLRLINTCFYVTHNVTEYCNLIGAQDSCALHKPMLTLFPDPLSLQSGSGNETTHTHCHIPTHTHTHTGAPPTYDSLFGVGEMRQQMKDAKQHSPNKGIFAVKFCEIMCNSSKQTNTRC